MRKSCTEIGSTATHLDEPRQMLAGLDPWRFDPLLVLNLLTDSFFCIPACYIPPDGGS